MLALAAAILWGASIGAATSHAQASPDPPAESFALEFPAPANVEAAAALDWAQPELLPDFWLMMEPDWVFEPSRCCEAEFAFATGALVILPPDAQLPSLPLDAPSVPVPAVEPPPKRIWEARVEFGLNGSEGNSERFATRYGGKIKRSTTSNLSTADILYSTSYANEKKSENKMLADARSEWPWEDSAWFAYTHGAGEYDQFTAYKGRVTSDSGFGYSYLKTTETTVKGRLGLGFSQEIKSPDEHFTPEGTLGFTFEHQLTQRQKLQAVGDVFPDLRDVQDFRVKSTASWEIKIDPPARLSLRFGVINRYDSTPNGKKRNDLDYSSLIVWEF